MGGCRKHSPDSNGSENTVVAISTISHVQIALEDQTYAEQLRGLLEADGKHRAYIVVEPNPIFAGVIVLDETTVDYLVAPGGRNAIRFLVLGDEDSDPNRLWDAGVRRLIPKQPPELVLSAILYTELLLSEEDRKKSSEVLPSEPLVCVNSLVRTSAWH